MVTGIHIKLDDSQEIMPAGMREKDYLFSPCKKYVWAYRFRHTGNI